MSAEALARVLTMAREAMQERHGCTKTRDEMTSSVNIDEVYYCSRHHVGWLHDVDGCVHVDAALDALTGLLADPGPLLAALAEAGVLREWATDSPLGPQHRYTTDWTEEPR